LFGHSFIYEHFLKDYGMCNNKRIISPTKSTPEVILDPQGIIKMTGRLTPENVVDFFNPIEEWIDEYFCNPADKTCIEICLEYINSAGTKYLLAMLNKIVNIHLKKSTEKFIINWYYCAEDEDTLEKGKLFSANLELPFNFITIT
jgi:hypothetical protein